MLEVGKTYRNRKGDSVEIIGIATIAIDGEQAFGGIVGRSTAGIARLELYSPNGVFIAPDGKRRQKRCDIEMTGR